MCLNGLDVTKLTGFSLRSLWQVWYRKNAMHCTYLLTGLGSLGMSCSLPLKLF